MSLSVGTAYDWSLDLLINVTSVFGTGPMPPQDFRAVLVKSPWQTTPEGAGA